MNLVNSDALHIPLAGGSVQTVITSPPYFGLRDYGEDGQLGLEPLHDCLGWATGDNCGGCYVCTMRSVFAEVWRVLRDDGTLWLNLGDSYNSGKQLAGIPWRVALALQADGWILRQDIIWHKPNPMPESVKDRCTKAHEYVFLLSKQGRYYYDAEAIKTKSLSPAKGTWQVGAKGLKHNGDSFGQSGKWDNKSREGMRNRNRRSVWTVSTKPYSGAHFAVFPPDLIEPMILAGSKPGDIVLDPFAGSGTTGRMAIKHGRIPVLCDLNYDYLHRQARKRTGAVQVNMLTSMGVL